VGPSQGSKDGVLDFLSAGREHLTFRLGVSFRQPLRPASPTGSLLPARYVRLQVASPPPRRVDGTLWKEGLVDSSGAPFDPAHPPADKDVVPLGGIAPLGRPDPTTIVLDRWLAVPAVPPIRALTRTFAMGTADTAMRPLTFLSVPYPDPSIDGTRLDVAGVAYYCEGKLEFDRPVDGEWIAVSLDGFFPPERASADYIVRVQPDPAVTRGTASTAQTEPADGAPTFPVTPAWRVDDPGTTSASRSSPGLA